jgi:hypothetical protein
VELAPESLVETDAEFEHLVADAEADELEGLSQQSSDAEVHAAEEAQSDEDLGEEIGEDTPLRQAQRAMIAEREEAVATTTPLVLAEAETETTFASATETEAAAKLVRTLLAAVLCLLLIRHRCPCIRAHTLKLILVMLDRVWMSLCCACSRATSRRSCRAVSRALPTRTFISQLQRSSGSELRMAMRMRLILTD